MSQAVWERRAAQGWRQPGRGLGGRPEWASSGSKEKRLGNPDKALLQHLALFISEN